MNDDEIYGDPKMLVILERVVKFEEGRMNEMRSEPELYGETDLIPYWRLSDTYINYHDIKKLILAGMIDKLGKKYYYLKSRESVKERLNVLNDKKQSLVKQRQHTIETFASEGFPPDLFDVVEGFEDLKDFIKMVLMADDSVHILLEGAPGTAKTILLMELERLGGVFITAGTATKVGIRDLIFEELPRIFIIDEIEKIDKSTDLSALLTWMESGKIYITKHGQREFREGKGIVFAACNTTKKIPPELLDRFQRFKIIFGF